MKSHRAIALCLLLVPTLAVAQNVKVEPESDPVLDAIQKFKKRDKSQPNEVKVVLFDTAAPAPAAPKGKSGNSKDTAAAPKEMEAKDAPKEVEKAATPKDEDATDAAVGTAAESVEDASPEPKKGLAVHVEQLHTGKGNIDPAQVKLLAPFPAKPLSQAPAGWHLDASDSAPPFTREVEISPGSHITLTIRPHLLVPDTDGVETFAIPEPGYDNSSGYRQEGTVGAILSKSIAQLDGESKQLGDAIDRLQQLLVSLPASEPQHAPTSKR